MEEERKRLEEERKRRELAELMAKIHKENESMRHLNQWRKNKRELLEIDRRHREMLNKVVKI